MKILRFPSSDMAENTYIYYDENALEGIIIDPGGDAEKIWDAINMKSIHITAILLTHGHFDHISAVPEIKRLSGAPVVAHKDENMVLKNADINLSVRGLRYSLEIEADRLLSEGDFIEIADTRLKIIHTPGHTVGGVCYYDEENAVLFSGDTLFFESIGNTSFPLGDMQTLFESITNKLFTLPDSVTVYPGHNESTSIGHEKSCNPYIDQGAS